MPNQVPRLGVLTLPAAPSTAVPLRTMTFPLLPIVLVPVTNERPRKYRLEGHQPQCM